MFRIKVYISLKKGLVDPQGIVVRDALKSLGYHDIAEVRFGKYIQLELKSGDEKKVEKDLKEMCQKVLVNPVIEEYNYEIEKLRRDKI